MNITLGFWLDSAAYPDALGEKEATCGNVVTGFNGLIGILENQLGLTAPKVSDNIRIAEWQELLRNEDTGKMPYSQSFSTDSWNTAKELLHRRDELILAGWDPHIHHGGSKWLDTLAKLELAGPKKSLGFPDRVRALITKLRDSVRLDIDSITIVDDEEKLWDPWCNQLLDLLKNLGVEIKKESGQVTMNNRNNETDLSLLQSVLNGETPSGEAKGDGTLLLIRSEQEWDAADLLISWLQNHTNENTVLIKGEGSLFLDELFHRRGVPGNGVDVASKWRAVLQVLPLTIDTYWAPIRVDRMMELLTIPASPVPGKIRFRLAKELASNPGIGGKQWLKAIDDGIRKYHEKWSQEGLDEAEMKRRHKKLVEKLDLWIRHDYYDPHVGIPFDQFAQICQKVSQWATSNFHMTNELIYMQAAQIADEVLEGVKTLGVHNVSHLQVARILDSVLGEGSKLESYQEEASNWQCVHHPGQIWKGADTILWWGFHKPIAGHHIRTWTKAERSLLKEQGVYLVEDNVRRWRDAAAWKKAATMANCRLILFAPSKVKGMEMPIHPLWDEIRFAIAKDDSTVQRISINAGELRKASGMTLSETKFHRIPLKMRTIPEPIRTWKVPKNQIQPRKEESATSFEGLISCPIKWTFKYAANIQPGNILATPNESIMLGNLGHVILENLFTEKSNWKEDEVRIRVGQLFDELTPMLAAPLLEPQNGILRNETRFRLQKSLQQFFKVLNESEIRIQHTELELQKSWNDRVEFKGRLDLVGETSSGKKVLFDAKWSKRPTNYKARLENISIQLSLYHWLLTDHEDEELPVAYFMLRTGHFYSVPHEEIPSDYHVQGPSLIETYKLIQKSVDEVWGQLAQGTVIAPGVPDTTGQFSEERIDEKPFVSIVDPPCKYCEYQNLCGYRRVKE